MTSKTIDGKTIAREIRELLLQNSQKLAEKDIILKMAIIHIGDDPASLSYTKSIQRLSSKLNIGVEVYSFKANDDCDSVIGGIERIAQNKDIKGVIVQEPIPSNFNREEIVSRIPPSKDIDCMNPINLGRVLRGNYTFAPSTPLGVLKILEYENIDVNGKHVVIVGRSNIVGKPLANLLLIKGKGGNATVTVCHSRTRNLQDFTKQADILVVAIGKARFITGDMVKQGAIIIDVGINDFVNDEGKHKLVGDVDFDSMMGIASSITPVPGGVGPITTLMLLSNLLKTAGINKATSPL